MKMIITKIYIKLGSKDCQSQVHLMISCSLIYYNMSLLLLKSHLQAT